MTYNLLLEEPDLLFSDEFGGSTGNLEDRSGWTRVGGSAGDATVNASGYVQSNTTDGTGAAYLYTDINPLNGYVGAKFLTSAGTGWACLQLTDASNYIGVRWQANDIEVYKRVAGSFTLIDTISGQTYGAAKELGIRLVGPGGGWVEVFVDRVLVWTKNFTNDVPATDRAGIVVRSATGDYFDDFVFGDLIQTSPTPFTDDFTGSNGEDIGDRSGWTRIGGSANDAEIQSNQVYNNATGTTPAAYLAPMMGEYPYAQAKMLTNSGNSWLCAQLTDSSNFVGCRWNSNNVEIYKRVSGSFTLIADIADSYAATKTLKIAVNGGTVTVCVDGTDITSGGISFTNNVPTSYRTGFVGRNVAEAIFDDFETGSTVEAINGGALLLEIEDYLLLEYEEPTPEPETTPQTGHSVRPFKRGFYHIPEEEDVVEPAPKPKPKPRQDALALLLLMDGK